MNPLTYQYRKKSGQYFSNPWKGVVFDVSHLVVPKAFWAIKSLHPPDDSLQIHLRNKPNVSTDNIGTTTLKNESL